MHVDPEQLRMLALGLGHLSRDRGWSETQLGRGAGQRTVRCDERQHAQLLGIDVYSLILMLMTTDVTSLNSGMGEDSRT